jgi:hypothetical protein
MNNLAAKKSVIMKLIEAMDDEMSEKLKPEEMDIKVMKLEGKPKMIEESEMEEPEMEDKEPMMESMDDEEEEDDDDMDFSMLDHLRKKYQKED